MKKAYVMILIAVILFLVDFGLTFYFVNAYENLVYEGNLLTRSEYGYLSLIVNLIYLIIIILLSIAISKYQTVAIDSKNAFVYTIKLYKSDAFKFMFISLAYAYVIATFVSRFSAIVDWIVFGIYKSNFITTGYAIFRSILPFGRYDVIIGLIVFLIMLPLWFYLEYRKSQQILKAQKDIVTRI